MNLLVIQVIVHGYYTHSTYKHEYHYDSSFPRIFISNLPTKVMSSIHNEYNENLICYSKL